MRDVWRPEETTLLDDIGNVIGGIIGIFCGLLIPETFSLVWRHEDVVSVVFGLFALLVLMVLFLSGVIFVIGGVVGIIQKLRHSTWKAPRGTSWLSLWGVRRVLFSQTMMVLMALGFWVGLPIIVGPYVENHWPPPPWRRYVAEVILGYWGVLFGIGIIRMLWKGIHSSDAVNSRETKDT